MNRYDIGDLVRCSAAFANAAGTAVDPTAVAFKVKDPSGTITTYVYPADSQLVKDDVGSYYVDINANASGTWTYRFNGTGTGQAAAEKSFVVEKSTFD